MKIYLVITTLAVLVSVAFCRPGRDVVEIQKQRLVKLASDSPRYQSNAETPETQRILQEIERINIAMGYKKKAQQLPVQRSNIQLEYFYPREEFRPFVLQRSSMLNRGSARYQNQAYHRARKITHKHSVLMPNPFNTQSYFYPAPYLQTPSNEPPKLFRINEQVYSITPVNLNFQNPEKTNAPKLNSTNNSSKANAPIAPLSFLPLRLEDIPQFLLGGSYAVAKDTVSVIEYLPNTIDDHPELDKIDNLRLSKARVTADQKNQLVNSIKKIVDSAKQIKKKILTTTESSIFDDLIDEIADDYLDDAVNNKNKNNPSPQTNNLSSTTTTTTELPLMEPLLATTVSTISQPIVVEPTNPESPDYDTAIELLADSYESQESESESVESESEEEEDTSSAQKTFTTFISSPSGAKQKPASNNVRIPSLPNLGLTKPNSVNSLKSPLGNIFGITDHTKEALREGGIVIQRLKVRRGGIAIAGPGGVATAGSGGTAIVGPGGVALTHPRSLAIAGPGAKVIALPESSDLEQLALSSSPRHLPLEGTIVATGPVVYYRAWQTQSLTSWPARPAVSARFIQTPFIGAAPPIYNTIPQNFHPVQHTAVEAGQIPLNPALYTPYGHPLPPSAVDAGKIQPVLPVQPETSATDQATVSNPTQNTNPQPLLPGQVITPTTVNTLPQPLHPGQAPVGPTIYNTLAYPVHPGFLTAGQLPINTAIYHTYAQPLPPTGVDVNQTPIDPIIYNSIPPTSVGAGTAPGALPIDPIEIPKGTPLPLEPVKPVQQPGNESDSATEQPNQEDSTELIFPPTTDDPEAFSTTEPTTQLPKDTMKLVDGTKSTIVKNANAGTSQSARPQKLKAQNARQQQRRPKQKKAKAKVQAQGKTAADVQVVRAVQQQNARFVVDQIYYVPGRAVPELSTVERVRVAPQKLVAAPAKQQNTQVKSLRLRKIQATPLVPGQQSQTFIIAPSQTKAQIQARKQMKLQAQLQAQIKAQKASIRKQQQQEQEDEEEYDVIADAIGSTSADKPIPGVPVETYFPDYNPARKPNPEGEATLILEPSAKAIAGQDGIAVSAPLSRAILRPGVTTRVLFRPDSVAIVGPGGKAHAQADLILDFLGDYQ